MRESLLRERRRGKATQLKLSGKMDRSAKTPLESARKFAAAKGGPPMEQGIVLECQSRRPQDRGKLQRFLPVFFCFADDGRQGKMGCRG